MSSVLHGIAIGSMFVALAANAQPIEQFTANMQRMNGLLPVYWDAKEGKLWIEVSHWNEPLLYIASLPAGLGVNETGLDRGLIPGSHLVKFERAGSRVLLIEENTNFRSSSGNAAERRAVHESFPVSVLWGFDAKAETADRALIDLTPFLERDALGAGKAIAEAQQGKYAVDTTRCMVHLDATKNFPQNTETEVLLTLTTSEPGKLIEQVAPDPTSITLREHHSFIALPSEPFEMRAFDPRMGYFPFAYRDYSAPLGEDIERRFIVRHRLTKDKPLVYYVDSGAPEDVRKALIEGASWWRDAFAAAGFPNGFEVRTLPPDADPMDVRYNVIEWVHRYTRGWSYGNAIIDPRNGEILQGHVTLGSLRYRQDNIIFSALLSPFGANSSLQEQVTNAVYARLRQLAAHETGHTLGLAHNFYASTDNNASVMDYPHPWIELNNGVPDLSHAYSSGIGEWDKIAIAYGYGSDPQAAVRDALAHGHVFITDEDSRPLGSAHPRAHLWDNGADPIAELKRLLTVRQAALARFGEQSIPPGRPMSSLDETLVPLYFLHRYQTEAAAKSIGGLDYTYALRGDGQTVTKIVRAADQRRALDAVLETLKPETLTLPERILKLIPPHPPGYQRSQESFPSQTGLTFDPVAGAEAAAELTGSLLFNAERDARLIEYHARDAAYPGLTDVLDATARTTWLAAAPAGLNGAVKRAVDNVLFRQMLSLDAGTGNSPLVRAEVQAWIAKHRTVLPAHLRSVLDEFENDPDKFEAAPASKAPPGQPIGQCIDLE